MIVITGGIGFIGYNLIKKLNEKKIYEIIVVDNLKGKKKNLPFCSNHCNKHRIRLGIGLQNLAHDISTYFWPSSVSDHVKRAKTSTKTL